MRHRSLTLALPALLLGLSGCFDIEQGLVLEKDLSGRATLRVTVDAEQLVALTVKLQRQFGGGEDKGEPTQEELAKARKELEAKLAEQSQEKQAKFDAERAALVASLPEGVELAEYAQELEGLRMTMRMTFAFDDVSKLARIELPEDEDEDEGMPGGPPKAGKPPVKKPFEGLVVDELEGGLVRVSFRPTNPADELKPEAEEEGAGEDEGGMGGKPGMGGAPGDEMATLMADAFKGLRVAMRISSTSMKVEDTNAFTREERAGAWEFDLKKLEGMKAEELAKLGEGAAKDPTPFVVFRRD